MGPMAGLADIVTQHLQPAFDALAPGAHPVVRPSDRADFQANGALALAKALGRPPRQLADEVAVKASHDPAFHTVEVAGPGFLNLTLDTGFLASTLLSWAADERLGVTPATPPLTVVVDYSAPNVAKQLAAHHLRTTIIGDALCRLLTFQGHRVVRENHIGDWGTPFGMLIEHLLAIGEEEGARELSIGDLDEFYRAARATFDTDPQFVERSRRRVVALQSGDPETLRLWHLLVDRSVEYFTEVYRELGVLLTRADVVGESFYNDQLPEVVAELDRHGLLVESEGARCVFPPGFVNRDGEPLPLIVQKSDGGYGYAATDLAALRDRFRRQHADLALYVVGAPQAQHFAMCFAVAHQAGWLPRLEQAVHVTFGNMLGSDRKMFKTRAGDVVKLSDLLEEATRRAAAAVADKNPDLAPADAARVAAMVGVGAIKYADLSTDRTRDYVFDWDRMLSFDGNTAPYLQYAHARIQSIFRRAELDPGIGDGLFGRPTLADPAERRLAIALLELAGAVDVASGTYSPHKLCTYLFDLAGAFTTFYETCPVLSAPAPGLRAERLSLCSFTARALATGLDLLGIAVPDRM